MPPPLSSPRASLTEREGELRYFFTGKSGIVFHVNIIFLIEDKCSDWKLNYWDSFVFTYSDEQQNRRTPCSRVLPVCIWHLRMQIHVHLMLLPSLDRKSDRDSVNLPLWSHEAPVGSVDVSLLLADAGSSKLAQTPVCLTAAGGWGRGLLFDRCFERCCFTWKSWLPPWALSAPLLVFMDSGFSISVPFEYFLQFPLCVFSVIVQIVAAA